MSRQADGALSLRLAELAKPAVRALSPARQARALSVASEGPGSLLRQGNRILVDVRFDHGAVAGVDALRAAGAKIVNVSRRYQTVTVAAKLAELHEVAGVARVAGVTEDLTPITYATCPSGAVVSEGDSQLHAADARRNFGLDGGGVTVGILSDSFNQATHEVFGPGLIATHEAEDIASGDLPEAGDSCGNTAGVNVLDDTEAEGADEGRAMAQIVHDLAPGALLDFATAFTGDVAFADNIRALQTAGAQVIADDVVYFNEPFFQDGPIAAAVNEVTSAGIPYFSAAGNDNLFDGSGREIASWEAPHYRDSGTCPAAVQSLAGFNGTHCMDFNPAGNETDTTFGITVAKDATLSVDLQWAEPWFGVNTDLDALLLKKNGGLVEVEGGLIGSAEDNVNVTEEPFEFFQWENKSGTGQEVQLVINRYAGGSPRLKFALLENGGGVTGTEYPASSGGDTVGPTIFGHSGAASAVSVGAVPFSTTKQPESYSSRGPVTHYFGPVSGNTAAAALVPPEEISKPDIVATDCGATTFFAQLVESTWRFCGTSAAAPHAAAVAALELQADPSATVAEIREAQTSTAGAVGSFGPDAVGAGLLNANAAVASLLPPATITITDHPPDRTSEQSPEFKFTATQGTSFTCAIDGVSPEPCSPSVPWPSPATLADGEHTFEVEATDVVASATYSFTVDTTPPTVTFKQRPPPETAETMPTFGFTASEPATFACVLDGTPQPCSSPYTVPVPLGDGPHTFEVIATDQLGHAGNTLADLTVDATPPAIDISSRPPDDTRDRAPTFGFASNEPTTFTCAIDGAIPEPCGSPYSAPTPLADGPHSFEVKGADRAGNVGRASASFLVDTRRPNTFLRAHPRHRIRIRGRKVRVAFGFGSNESGARFICKVDRGLLHFCGSIFSKRFQLGKHYLLVRAVDLAGNVDRTPAVFHFKVKQVG